MTGDYSDFLAKSIMNKLKNYTDSCQIELEKRLLGDWGGGIGTLANSLNKYFNQVFSYDIAKDAGEYGKKQFPKVNFITKGITDREIFEEGPFNVLIAYEFYPYTRTSEWDYQKKYIDMCLLNLKKDGLLIIGTPNSRKKDNIMRNKRLILQNYSKKHQVKIFRLPSYQIFKVIKNLYFTNLLSDIFSVLRDSHYLIIMHK